MSTPARSRRGSSLNLGAWILEFLESEIPAFPASLPGDGLLDELSQLEVLGSDANHDVVGPCSGAQAGDLLAEVEQLLLLLAVDEHEVILGDLVGIVRMARLLEALAYGLDSLVSLIGDVGDLGRGSF